MKEGGGGKEGEQNVTTMTESGKGDHNKTTRMLEFEREIEKKTREAHLSSGRGHIRYYYLINTGGWLVCHVVGELEC